MSSRSWVASSLVGRPAGDVLLGLRRPYPALADVIRRPDRGVSGEPEHVVFTVAAELEQVAAGVLGGGVLRAGDAGDGGQADGDGAAELPDHGLRFVLGDGGQAVVAGVVPGVDQAAEPPLSLGWPVRVRVGLGGVLVIPEYVGQARLVPSDVLPTRRSSS